MSVTETAVEAPLRVLVADDQEDIRTALQLALKGRGFAIETADSPEAVLSAVAGGGFDAVLMDLNYTRDTTSGAEGLEVLPRLKAMDGDLAVFVMTAWGTIGLAIEAMRSGAADFVLKPWSNDAVVAMLRREVARSRAARAARGRTAGELEAAVEVQTRLLPQRLPRLATLECAAHCLEVSGVGGDGYDFIDLGSGRMAVLLADVSGKGMAAALLWATLRATVRSQADRAASDLAGLLAEVNRAFIDCSAPERYATLFMGVYDDATRRLRYVNCGHNPPLLLRAHGACGRLPATAPVIGLLPEWEGGERQIALAPGDTLLLYSDGVTEAGGAHGAEFGEDRLAERLKACRGLAASLLPAAIVGDVQAFAGAQDDDITVLALRGR